MSNQQNPFEYEFHYTIEEMKSCKLSTQRIEQSMYVTLDQITLHHDDLQPEQFFKFMDTILFLSSVVTYRIFGHCHKKCSSLFITYFVKRQNLSLLSLTNYWKQLQSHDFTLAYVQDSICAFALLWFKLSSSKHIDHVKYRDPIAQLVQFFCNTLRTLHYFFSRLHQPYAKDMQHECSQLINQVNFDGDTKLLQTTQNKHK